MYNLNLSSRRADLNAYFNSFNLFNVIEDWIKNENYARVKNLTIIDSEFGCLEYLWESFKNKLRYTSLTFPGKRILIHLFLDPKQLNQ
jgi:hypothetical protein